MKKKRDLTKLRKAIYDFDNESTHENACIITQLTEDCTSLYGKKETDNAISAALCVLRKRNRT